MKKCLLFLITMFLCTLLFAQDKAKNDEVKIGKYLLKSISNPDNTYGYEIYENGNLIVKQASKPYVNIPKGFTKKENALKFARFHMGVIDLKKDHSELMNRESIKQLNLSSEDFSAN
jgi:hypothetical protein